jgi:hypothetical protein
VTNEYEEEENKIIQWYFIFIQMKKGGERQHFTFCVIRRFLDGEYCSMIHIIPLFFFRIGQILVLDLRNDTFKNAETFKIRKNS